MLEYSLVQVGCVLRVSRVWLLAHHLYTLYSYYLSSVCTLGQCLVNVYLSLIVVATRSHLIVNILSTCCCPPWVRHGFTLPSTQLNCTNSKGHTCNLVGFNQHVLSRYLIPTMCIIVTIYVGYVWRFPVYVVFARIICSHVFTHVTGRVGIAWSDYFIYSTFGVAWVSEYLNTSMFRISLPPFVLIAFGPVLGYTIVTGAGLSRWLHRITAIWSRSGLPLATHVSSGIMSTSCQHYPSFFHLHVAIATLVSTLRVSGMPFLFDVFTDYTTCGHTEPSHR